MRGPPGYIAVSYPIRWLWLTIWFASTYYLEAAKIGKPKLFVSASPSDLADRLAQFPKPIAVHVVENTTDVWPDGAIRTRLLPIIDAWIEYEIAALPSAAHPAAQHHAS